MRVLGDQVSPAGFGEEDSAPAVLAVLGDIERGQTYEPRAESVGHLSAAQVIDGLNVGLTEAPPEVRAISRPSRPAAPAGS